MALPVNYQGRQSVNVGQPRGIPYTHLTGWHSAVCYIWRQSPTAVAR
jgi:hypothetical protein